MNFTYDSESQTFKPWVEIRIMTLKQAKVAIRSWIQTHFSDQRLAEVYAFNRDGKMKYEDPCGCLLGVTLAKQLHNCPEYGPCIETVLPAPSCSGVICFDETAVFDNALVLHYDQAVELQNARVAEFAYDRLGFWNDDECFLDEEENGDLRQRRMSAIVRAEIRRRDRLRSWLRNQLAEEFDKGITARLV
jgi:hypothetical protein